MTGYTKIRTIEVDDFKLFDIVNQDGNYEEVARNLYKKMEEIEAIKKLVIISKDRNLISEVWRAYPYTVELHELLMKEERAKIFRDRLACEYRDILGLAGSGKLFEFKFFEVDKDNIFPEIFPNDRLIKHLKR